MSTPEPPSGPPAEAGPAPEPGHRARALAASLLGELTGQRRSGLTFSPLEPSGLSVEPTAARSDDAPRPAPEQSPADPASPPPVEPEDAVVEADPETLRVETVQAETATAEPEDASPEPADAPPVDAPPVEAPPVEAPRLVADEAPRPAEQQGTGPLRAVPAPVGATGPALRAVPDAPPAAPRPQAPAAERAASPAASLPLASAALAPHQPSASAPARSSEGGASPSQEVRPAPFAYLAVAQHHTNPARATANGALDQAGQRISSRVDRALVRRAALVTMEAASLLDACDVLDGRARAADATWTGEHHSPTEVREFEGAWGAFYDAQGALASHVTS